VIVKRVFVSSLLHGFEELRSAAEVLLGDLRCGDWSFEPILLPEQGPTSGSPQQAEIAAIRGCDVFLGIYGAHMGYFNSSSGLHAIHEEFRLAVNGQKPVLIFERVESLDSLSEHEVQARDCLWREINDYEKGKMWGRFRTTQEFTKQLKAALEYEQGRPPYAGLDVRGKVHLLLQKATDGLRRAWLPETIGYLLSALWLAESNGIRAEMAQVNLHLANVYRFLRDDKQAERCCLTAIDLGDFATQLHGRLLLAKVQLNHGRLCQAQETLQRLAETEGTPSDVEQQLSEARGCLCYLKGHYGEAAQHWEQAQKSRRELGVGEVTGLLELSANLIRAYSRMSGKASVAQKLMDEANYYINRLGMGDDALRADLSCSFAELMMRDGRLNEARRMAEQACSSAERTWDVMTRVHSLCLRGIIERELGQLHKARWTFEQAEALLPGLRHPYYGAWVHVELGDALLGLDAPEEAQKRFALAEDEIRAEPYEELWTRILARRQKQSAKAKEVHNE
jgi:tetratricopeptide (TPR) repeat protein